MKKTLFTTALAVTFASAGTAVAADIQRGPTPYYSTPAALAVYNWRGPYAGLNVGYQWSKVTNSAGNPSGVMGGGQLGYNWQIDQFVFGGETDIQYSSADDTFAPYKFSNPWFGTLRGRAGVALDKILLYATAGLAYGGLNGEIAGLSENKTLLGWTAGFGMEVGFTPRWSAKAEYLYMDLGERAYSITGADHGLHSNLVRFGINYHF